MGASLSESEAAAALTGAFLVAGLAFFAGGAVKMKNMTIREGEIEVSEGGRTEVN